MLKSLVFNQFYDLRKNGKDPLKARTHVILLLSVMIVLALLALYFLVLKLGLLRMPTGMFGFSGKFVGRVGGMAFLGLVFGLSYLGLGKNIIEMYWQEFQSLDAASQEMESKKGAKIFFISFFSLLGAVVILACLNL